MKAWALGRVARVLAAAASERIRPSGPLRPGELPRSPEGIDADWLTAALGASFPGARVSAVRVLGGSAGTTTRRAFELEYAGDPTADLPRRLFVKCTTGVSQRLMLGLGGFIETEPGFYAEVRPGLEIEAPVGYFGAVDPRTWRSIVMMEDVTSTRGASFWRPTAKVAREQVEDLLANAARWHGALWDSPRLAGWPWLKSTAEQMRLIDALIAMADRTRAGVRRAAPVIPPALRARRSDLYEGMRRSMQIAGAGERTYLHGDLHVANTYATASGRMGVADWQAGLQGSWAFDYAYLLITALEVEDRRAWERELLDGYLERLAAAGGRPPPREQAWLAYRQATLYPFFAWAYTIGRSRLQPRFQPEETSLTMLRRIAAAIEDLDSLAAVGLR